MLIISRKKDEKIIVDDNIEITILEVGRTRVRFGIQAPREVSIKSRLKEPAQSGKTASVSPGGQPNDAIEAIEAIEEPVRKAAGKSKSESIVDSPTRQSAACAGSGTI